MSSIEATKLETCCQCLFNSCLVVEYILIQNLFLIEADPWFPIFYKGGRELK